MRDEATERIWMIEDLQAMNAAVMNDDYETVLILGHSLKERAARCDTVQIGEGLEAAARNGDALGIRRWMAELARVLYGFD